MSYIKEIYYEPADKIPSLGETISIGVNDVEVKYQIISLQGEIIDATWVDAPHKQFVLNGYITAGVIRS